MITRTIASIALFIFSAPSLSGEALKEISVMWGDVADITLPIGVEQTIATDPLSNLDVGLPSEISDRLSLLNVGGRIFLTANETFEDAKLILKHHERGSTIINLSASDSAIEQNYTLYIPPAPPQATVREMHPCPANYVEITRWALHQMYAPERILKDENCFSNVKVALATIDMFVCNRTMLCGGGVSATPIFSWRSANNLFIHAIALENNRTQKIILDARDVVFSKEMLAITFAHGWLDVEGNIGDNTVAVLITSTKLENTSFAYSEARQ